MIDFHSHVLPEMDDGSQSVEMSIEMLRRSAEQGINIMAATPHYYAAKEDIPTFLSRREEAAAVLQSAMEGLQGLPELRFGAEVAYFPGISAAPELEKLCIKGTRVLLLEMSFDRWGKQVFKDLDGLTAVRGLTVVIAHIERYAGAQNSWKTVRELLNYDVLIQSNAEFFLGRWSRLRALRMLRAGEIQLLGSDSHNLTSRAPNLGMACDVIAKKLGEQRLNEIEHFADQLLNRYANV